LNVERQFPIVPEMNWLVGGSLLAGCGFLLRRLLHLDARGSAPLSRFHTLDRKRETIYQSIAQDLETQCTILGITLNDAIDERDAGHGDTAWRLVRLSAGEWDRVTEVLGGVIRVLGKHIPLARAVVPLRSVSAQRFKSRTMIDFFRMYELLDQLVFRSRMRFQLQIRVMRRANETLTAEFRRIFRYAERTGDHSPEFWSGLDLLFHDLDLLSKEALLAFRAFLLCLPDSALAAFAADLEALRPQADRIIPV
jgi:hypothetical protein